MKKIILVAICTLCLTACRNDENNSLDNSNSVILPVKIIYTNLQEGGNQTLNFTYKNEKISTITFAGFDGDKIAFEYTDDLITKMISIDGTDKSETVFTYNNGSLASSKYNNSENNGLYMNTGVTNYAYNADGTVTANETEKRTKKDDTSYNYTSTTKYAYTLSNGQITKKVATYISTPYNHVETTSYTYDTKNSIFKNVKGFSALVLGLNKEIGESFSLTQNNYTGVNWSSGTSTSNSQYTVEYNTNGYPSKIVETYNGTKEAEYIVTYNK